MTFVAPLTSSLSAGPAIRPLIPAGKGRLPLARGRAADEDSARRALGTDFALPSVISSGAVIEDLARIALG
jgi:hypothetical protein